MIKYLGSKRLLLPHILDAIRSIKGVKNVADLFSGTSRVGHALKAAGYGVQANDINLYAHSLALCYVQAERSAVVERVTGLLSELNGIKGSAGYFTETFCERSRFFQPHNGERIDAIRSRIDSWELDPVLKAICLVSLMEAADRVDSTTGVQMAYLKGWSPRSFNRLELRLPALLDSAPGRSSEAHCLEGAEAAAVIEADLAYLDPPYNQHSYLGNYHIWESLIRWDKPEVYGVACKRIDCRSRKSAFNSKPRALEALTQVIRTLKCRHLVVSFNDEGFIDRPTMEALLSERGHVSTFVHPYKRYVGAQIGIYNPGGERVGAAGPLNNREYLYVVSESPVALALS